MAKEVEIRTVFRNIVKQNLEKIVREGKVTITSQKTVGIDVNSKESLRAAVKLILIRPFRNGEQVSYSEKNKKELISLLEIYDEVFEDVYNEFKTKNDFKKISDLAQKMNEYTKNNSNEIVDKAKNKYPTYDDRN